MGGVLWRWAIEFLKPEDALEGPSPQCFQNAPVCTKNGVRYYDDSLSRDECGVILGCYRVLTGSGKQTEIVSIFPFPKTRHQEGAGIYHWTPADEKWFHKLVDNIALNRNKSEWRKSLRPKAPQRRGRRHIERHAAQCFDTQGA